MSYNPVKEEESSDKSLYRIDYEKLFKPDPIENEKILTDTKSENVKRNVSVT